MKKLPLAFLLLVLQAYLGGQLYSQVPTLNGWYKDDLIHGYKVKAPKDWQSLPPAPDFQHLQAWYEPDTTLATTSILLVFAIDSADPTEPQSSEKIAVAALNTLAGKLHKKDSGVHWSKPGAAVSVAKGKGENFEVELLDKSKGVVARASVTLLQLTDDLRVAYLGYCAEEKDWDSFQAACETGAKSFKLQKVKKSKTAESAWEKRLLALRLQEKNCPDWQLIEAGDFLLFTEISSKKVVSAISKSLQAFGPQLVGDLSLADSSLQANPIVVVGFDQYLDQLQFQGKQLETVPDIIDWYNKNREVAFYDKKAAWGGGGRETIWGGIASNIFSLLLRPAGEDHTGSTWFDSGHQNFYRKQDPLKKKGKALSCECHGGETREVLEQEKLDDLKYFVNMERLDWKKGNSWCTSWQYDALSWSLVYFLRTGSEASYPGWQEEWSTILPKYFASFQKGDGHPAAALAAFEGVDFLALEESWRRVCKGFAKK
jgi:hypothetical protein